MVIPSGIHGDYLNKETDAVELERLLMMIINDGDGWFEKKRMTRADKRIKCLKHGVSGVGCMICVYK